jgi:hypothetical protein
MAPSPAALNKLNPRNFRSCGRAQSRAYSVVPELSVSRTQGACPCDRSVQCRPAVFLRKDAEAVALFGQHECMRESAFGCSSADHGACTAGGTNPWPNGGTAAAMLATEKNFRRDTKTSSSRAASGH